MTRSKPDTAHRIVQRIIFAFAILYLAGTILGGMGLDLASPKEAVADAKVPVFLIHGTSDRNIPPYNSEDIQAANPANVVLWLVPQAEHCGAHSVAPADFDRRILSWLSEHSKLKKLSEN